jgi:hypothetical protein
VCAFGVRYHVLYIHVVDVFSSMRNIVDCRHISVGGDVSDRSLLTVRYDVVDRYLRSGTSASYVL